MERGRKLGIFNYRGRNRHGELFTGEIHAENIHEAALQIRSRGLWVVGLDEEVLQPPLIDRIKDFFLQDINIPGFSNSLGKETEVMILSQLASLIQAGLPLQQALCAMEKYGEDDVCQKLKKQLEHDVSSGRQLWEAMGRYPEVFSETVRTCIKAGENSGSLGEILLQLSLQSRKSLKVRERLKSALLYPAILLTLMVLSMFVVAVFILPTFVNLLGNIHGELPLATVVLLTVADFLSDIWGKLIVFIAFLAVPLLVVTVMKKPCCRLQLDKIMLAVPALGKLGMHSEWLQVFGTLGVLLRSGIKLVDGLHMVIQVPCNTYIKKCLEKIYIQVKQGRTLTESLAICKYIPWQARELLAAGEQVGRLEEMLFETADICQDEAEQESARLLVLVEPFLTLILGTVLLFLVMAIIMPVLNVMDVLL